jgi:hypothetical protein
MTADAAAIAPDNAWNRFWFRPGARDRLALCRILFFGGLLAFYLPYDASNVGHLPRVFYLPVWILDVLHLPPPTFRVFVALQWLWRAALLLSFLGLFTRAATGVALLVGIYVIGVPNSFGKVGHGDAILIWGMLAMFASRPADAYSLDALIRRRRGRTPPGLDTEYFWPIRFMWIVMAVIFSAAGIAKLRTSGLAWITGDSMSNTLMAQRYPGAKSFLFRYFGYTGEGLNIGLWIAKHELLAKGMAAMTIVIEIGMLLTPFSRRARYLIVPMMGLCQLGMGFVLGVLFPPFSLNYLFWIPWDRLLARVKRLVTRDKAVGAFPVAASS